MTNLSKSKFLLGKFYQTAINSKSFLNSQSQTELSTIHEIRQGLMRLVGSEATWGNGESIDKALLSSYLKKNQQDLIKQTMKESYAEAIIPLGDMPELRNKYANFQQAVRFGRLLEDLDTMAVHISYLHNKSQRVTLNGFSLSPIVIVTALVDRIEDFIRSYNESRTRNK
jgi:acyl-coenzyme A thioesterase 9